MTKAISLPFAFDQSGSIAYTKDEKKIWQDRVVLVLMTRLGERIMRPTFGSEIGDSLFESEESATTLIKKSVSVAFSRWLKQLELISVTTDVDPTDGYIIIDVGYRYSPRENEQRVKIKTAILSRSGEIILEVSE
jgi:phage baseplate assembly protein W